MGNQEFSAENQNNFSSGSYQDDSSLSNGYQREGADQFRKQENPHDVHTYVSWHAASRPYKKRKKEFFLNIFIIMLFLEIIGFLFHQGLLMTLIASFVFCVCALYLVPPHDAFYRISSEGITVGESFFLWKELYDFYFKSAHTQEILIIRIDDYLLSEVTVILGAIHKEQMKNILLRFLPYREYVKPTFVEKSGDWLSKTFPLEQ